MKIFFSSLAYLSMASALALGISSYQVQLQFKFMDGTSAKETLVTEGGTWVTKVFGKNTVKLLVEPLNKTEVKTTFEIAEPGMPRNQSQIITRLNEPKFASIESKQDETGKTREIKIAVKENLLDDSEK